MFIGLFGWGANYFGWHDPAGKVQLALVHELHPGRGLRLQVEGLSAATWRGGGAAAKPAACARFRPMPNF